MQRPTPQSHAVSIDQLTFRYPGSGRTTVLNIPHWQIAQGEQVFLKGPSGSGKTTLLNLLAGTLCASSGTLKVLGVNLAQRSARQRDHFRAAHIGVVFQQFNLIPYLSVRDNLLLAAKLGGTTTAAALERSALLFDTLKLDEQLLSEHPTRLSAGQQQRAAIVRALVNAPEILIADEPTSALDSQLRDSFVQHLLALTREWQSTLIFVSHDDSLGRQFQRVTALAEINRHGDRHAD
jgi:putative ABC transport system ATP-binding protein